MSQARAFLKIQKYTTFPIGEGPYCCARHSAGFSVFPFSVGRIAKKIALSAMRILTQEKWMSCLLN
jgi:hypothetical protein